MLQRTGTTTRLQSGDQGRPGETGGDQRRGTAWIQTHSLDQGPGLLLQRPPKTCWVGVDSSFTLILQQ